MILIIDNYDSFTYNLYQMIKKRCDDTVVIKHDEMDVTTVQALKPQGIVLSPGPGRPIDAGICLDVVRALSGSVPLFGVCLGHQVIAEAFGGRVIHADTIMHGKASWVSHQGGELYRDLPNPFTAGRYHSLVVDPTTLPDVLNIEASTESGVIMGMRHCEHPTFGVQFHPESILSHAGWGVVENFMVMCET